MVEATTVQDAEKQLGNIEASLNRVINQIRESCIEVEIKKRMLEDLNEMAFEVHHLTAFETKKPEKAPECTTENPCCDRRDEYNGFASGPLIFECPKNCSCHD